MIQMLCPFPKLDRVLENVLMPETFGEWLKNKRLMRGQSQRVLGDKAGVSDAIVSLIEHGKRKPSREMVKSLASALEVDPEPGLLAAGFLPGSFSGTAKGTSTANATLTVTVNEQGIRYVSDPDTAETVEYYEGLSPTNRGIAKSLIQQLREAERRDTIGGGSGTREVFESGNDADSPEPD